VGNFAWKFKVERTDPLTPQDEAIHNTIKSLLAKSEVKGVLGELYSWADQISNHCFETVQKGSNVVSRLSYPTNDCSETLKTILMDCFDTLEQTSNDCPETLLKILKSIKESQVNQETSSTQDSPNVHSRPVDRVVEVVTIYPNGNWSLEKLLVRTDQKTRQALLSQEDGPIPFVSWVIYGVSQPCIHNPYSLAIAKLRGNPKIGAGGAGERLAQLSPIELAKMVEQGLGWNSPVDSDWHMLFGNAGHDRIRLLADLLGIELDNQEGRM
jgi:hypothetical protein